MIRLLSIMYSFRISCHFSLYSTKFANAIRYTGSYLPYEWAIYYHFFIRGWLYRVIASLGVGYIGSYLPYEWAIYCHFFIRGWLYRVIASLGVGYIGSYLCREEENLIFCFGALFNSTPNFTQSG